METKLPKLYLKKNQFSLYMKNSNSMKMKLTTVGITKIILSFCVLAMNKTYYIFNHDLGILIKTLMFLILIIGICYLLFTDTLNFKLGSIGLAVLDNINFNIESLTTSQSNIIYLEKQISNNQSKDIERLSFKSLPEIETILKEKQVIEEGSLEDFRKLIKGEKIENKISLKCFNDKNKFVYARLFNFLNEIIEKEISTFYGKSRRILLHFIVHNFHQKKELFKVDNLRKRYSEWLKGYKSNTDIYLTLNQTCNLSDYL